MLQRRSFCGASLIWLTACVTSGHGAEIDQRLSSLEADSKDQRDSLEAQKQQLQAQLPKLDEKLKEVSAALDHLNQATHQSGADVGVRLDELQEQIQRLRGSIEESQHRLEQVTSAEQQAQKDSDLKLAAAIGPQALAEATAKEKAVKMAPADRSALYALAYHQLQQEKDYDVSRELFLEYLRRYPKDALDGEAQYGVAQSQYLSAKYKEAALAFGKVSELYPQSTKACDARLGIGLSFAALKLKDDARAALEETLTHCAGKVAVAKEAKAKLAELKKKR
jgi:TolA-binding protein